jgi:hypothetical protein
MATAFETNFLLFIQTVGYTTFGRGMTHYIIKTHITRMDHIMVYM